MDAAEAESGRKTAQHVAARLEQEITPILASLSQSIGRELKAFQGADLTLQSLDFRTTATALHASLRFQTPVNPPPSGALPADTDLGIRVHESLANLEAQRELGGRSFRLDELSKIYNEVTRGLIRDGRKEADVKLGLKKVEKMLADLAGKPVTITLAKQRPLTVAFADQGFIVEARIATVRQEKAVYSGLEGRRRLSRCSRTPPTAFMRCARGRPKSHPSRTPPRRPSHCRRVFGCSKTRFSARSLRSV